MDGLEAIFTLLQMVIYIGLWITGWVLRLIRWMQPLPTFLDGPGGLIDVVPGLSIREVRPADPVTPKSISRVETAAVAHATTHPATRAAPVIV